MTVQHGPGVCRVRAVSGSRLLSGVGGDGFAIRAETVRARAIATSNRICTVPTSSASSALGAAVPLLILVPPTMTSPPVIVIRWLDHDGCTVTRPAALSGHPLGELLDPFATALHPATRRLTSGASGAVWLTRRCCSRVGPACAAGAAPPRSARAGPLLARPAVLAVGAFPVLLARARPSVAAHCSRDRVGSRVVGGGCTGRGGALSMQPRRCCAPIVGRSSGPSARPAHPAHWPPALPAGRPVGPVGLSADRP